MSRRKKRKTNKPQKKEDDSEITISKKKVIITSIIIVAVVAIIMSAGILYVNIDIRSGKDLVVYLTPYEKFVEINNGENIKVEFEVSTNRRYFCTSTCEYKLVDLSDSAVKEEEDFFLERAEKKLIEFSFTAPERGVGKKYYNLNLVCQNTKSSFCVTSGEEIHSTRLIVIRYGPNETSLNKASKIKEEIINEFNYVSKVITKVRNIKHQIEEINYSSLTEADTANAESILASAEAAAEEYKDMAEIYNDYKVSQFISLSSDFDPETEKLEEETEMLSKSLKQKIREYNQSLKLFESIFMPDTMEDILKATGSFTVMDHARNIISDLNNRNFSNSTKEEIQELNDTFSEQYRLALDASGRDMQNLTEQHRFNAYIICHTYPHCTLENNSCSCLPGIKSDKEDKLSGNIAVIEEICSLDYEEEYKNIRESYMHYLYRKATNTTNSSNLTLEYINHTLWNISGINSYLSNHTLKDELDNAASEWVNYVISNSNKSMHNITTGEFNTSINISEDYFPLYRNIMPVTIDNSSCIDQKPLSYAQSYFDIFNNTNVSDYYISIQDTHYNYTDSINFIEFEEKCCIYGNCFECCNKDQCYNDTASYPVILIHGHAFSKSSDPESSLELLYPLQNKLKENYYISGGIINPNTEIINMNLGIKDHPFTYQATYYYDVFEDEGKYIILPRKSESIDVYSIRLKEIIDYAVEKTNREKVNIIAHSMGGLVARRYLQIFGTEKVEKLIMIGTPNKGVRGKIGTLCDLFGGDEECEDMEAGSIFLNKLNDPNKQPEVEEYMIIGRGCSMDNDKDGDGIVAVEDAEVDNATTYYIDGDCQGLNLLHNDMLDPEQYPETFEIVSEILEE